jgi:hypothetical protein
MAPKPVVLPGNLPSNAATPPPLASDSRTFGRRAAEIRTAWDVFCRFVYMHFPMKKQQQAHVQLGVSRHRVGDVQPDQPGHQDGQIDLPDDRFQKGQ